MFGSGPGDLLRVTRFLGKQDREGAEERTSFVVETRHSDGDRWVEVRRYRSEQEADEALSKLIGEGHATRDDHRVHKLRIDEPDID